MHSACRQNSHQKCAFPAGLELFLAVVGDRGRPWAITARWTTSRSLLAK